ncbi:MAG: hypothetical protein ACC707_01980, partial [Thiohalomonadales bacterium]
RTRVLAERAIFIAERQGTILRWQVEQVFLELLLVPEFNGFLSSTSDINQALLRVSTALETIPKKLTTESETITTNLMHKIEKERENTINHISEQLLNKSFILGILLILVFMISALFVMLTYKYFSLKIGQLKTG